jgi:hypothetical protein
MDLINSYDDTEDFTEQSVKQHQSDEMISEEKNEIVPNKVVSKLPQENSLPEAKLNFVLIFVCVTIFETSEGS